MDEHIQLSEGRCVDFDGAFCDDNLNSFEWWREKHRGYARREAMDAVSLFGSEHVITARQPDLGGDDFAEYILRVPGAYAYVGSGNPENPDTLVAHHNSHFDIDEEALPVAVALYTCYSVEYLNRLV